MKAIVVPKTREMQFEAEALLKTVALLERPYGAGYVSRILRGEESVAARNTSHVQFETFGALPEYGTQRTLALVEYLVRNDYLSLSDPAYGTLQLTPKGRKYLGNPQPMEVALRELRLSELGKQLREALRDLRLELSEKEEIPPYEVFNNYTLYRMVEARPSNVSELKAIAGISDAQADRYGQAILATIARATASYREKQQQAYVLRAYSPAVQRVKALYREDSSAAEIAEALGLKESTIRGYLESLHLAGELDLRPWIERQVDARSLHRAADFFRQLKQARLREAYEALGIDYETLRLCRLYVAQVQRQEDQIELAA